MFAVSVQQLRNERRAGFDPNASNEKLPQQCHPFPIDEAEARQIELWKLLVSGRNEKASNFFNPGLKELPFELHDAVRRDLS